MPLTVTLTDPAANGDPVTATVQVNVVFRPFLPNPLAVRVIVADEANGDDEVYEAKDVGGDMYEANVVVTPGSFYTVGAVVLVFDPVAGTVSDSGSDARIKCRA